MASRTHVAHMQRRLLPRREVDDDGPGPHRAHGVGHQAARRSCSGEKVPLQDGEVIDSMYMSRKALCDFYEEQMETPTTPASCSRCTLRRP